MLKLLPWFLMTIVAVGVSGYALINLVMPEFRSQFIQNIFTALPNATSLHLLGGFVAMFIGTFQLNSKLRVRFLPYHRWVGRLYVLAVVIGGVSGFLLALNSVGGMTAQFGFALMAICWVGSTLLGYFHMRQHSVEAHRNWMIRSYALTLAGVTLRIYLGIGFLTGTPFSEFYPVLSWISWVPNLLIVEWFILSRLSKPIKV